MPGDEEAVAAIGERGEVAGDALQPALEQSDAALEDGRLRHQQRVDDDEDHEREGEEARGDPRAERERAADADEGDARGGEEGHAAQGRDRGGAALEDVERRPELGEALRIVSRSGFFGGEDGRS